VITKEMHENGMCRIQGCQLQCGTKASSKTVADVIGAESESEDDEGSERHSDAEDSDEADDNTSGEDEDAAEESGDAADRFADAHLPIPVSLRQAYELFCMKLLRKEAWYEVSMRTPCLFRLVL
jgi:hypothetical protein